MKFKEFKHTPVQPDTYEASMALNQLMRIGKHAIKLHNMIDDAAEMESWVAKKIDLAGDYVKKVYNYTEGEKAGLYDDGGLTEEAPFGSGMDLVRMAVLRKFISAEEYMAYAKELKAAGEEVAQNYDDWPEGEGFGSSDGNFAIKDLMTTAGYEFDEQDRGGRFIVTKMPEKLEKMGIKNVRMRDAVTTEDAGDMDLIGDGAENLGLDPNKFDYYYDTSGAGYGEVRTKSGKSILQFEYDRDGDAEVSTMDNKTIANIKQGEQLPNNVTAKLNMIKEGASFYGYYKDPKDPEGRRMTYPDDMEFKTPHRSNAAARMLLQRIGLDPDFENTESTPIDDFIAATDKYLRMNVSDKDNPEYDEVEVYDQEARRIKKTHPEVTHVGFN